MSIRKLVLSPAAVRHYKSCTARVRALLKQAMQVRLIDQDPTVEDRNRFRLHRISKHADFELRVEEWRMFYRVKNKVVILELIGKKVGNKLIIAGEEFIL